MLVQSVFCGIFSHQLLIQCNWQAFLLFAEKILILQWAEIQPNGAETFLLCIEREIVLFYTWETDFSNSFENKTTPLVAMTKIFRIIYPDAQSAFRNLALCPKAGPNIEFFAAVFFTFHFFFILYTVQTHTFTRIHTRTHAHGDAKKQKSRRLHYCTTVCICCYTHTHSSYYFMTARRRAKKESSHRSLLTSSQKPWARRPGNGCIQDILSIKILNFLCFATASTGK